MNKIYEYHAKGGQYPILPIIKWLRKNGEMGRTFVIHQMNYRILRVEFLDSKLELMYTMKYDWTKPASKIS
jgi:hypothetical protein